MQNIRGVYVPAVLLIIGVGIVKKEWIPFAAIAAAVLGGLQIYMSRTLRCTWLRHIFADMLPSRASQIPQA